MSDIQPFRGLRYNQSITKDLSTVICPPYDIIPPSLHKELHERSEYNFIRLEDASSTPTDTTDDNKYTRSAATLRNWLKEKILVSEAKPAIYIHDHYFRVKGKEMKRRGLIVRIRLEDWEKNIVRPHENTIAAARTDRLNLLWALQINTSPILSMYQDPGQKLAAILNQQETQKPDIDTRVPEGERHVVRAVTDPAVLSKISAHFKDLPVYIADGHHRYTSALNFRNEKAKCSPLKPDDPVNFVMMTLIDFADPGMVIMGTHRVLRNLPEQTLAGLDAKVKKYFEIKKLPVENPGTWNELDRLFADDKYVRIACLRQAEKELMVLTLTRTESLIELMPDLHSDLIRRLDVSVVDHVFLGKVLGLPAGFSDESKISYVHDRDESAEMVLKKDYQLAIFVKAVKPEFIKAVADAGEKMPRKSTYFVPKAPAGLVMNSLVD